MSSLTRAISPLNAIQSATALRPIFPLTGEQHVYSPTPDSKTTIAYEDTGEIGVNDQNVPVLFFIPGMGEFRQTYRFVAPEFYRDDYRVICMDLRGQGHSSADFESYTLEDIVIDISSVLKHAEVKSRIVFIGNSISGAAITIFAAKYPDKVHGLILINPILREMPGDKIIRPLSTVVLTSIWGPTAWLSYWRTLFTAPDHKPGDFEIYAAALKTNLKEEGRITALKGFGQASRILSWKCILRVSAPVLAIYGGNDPEYPNVVAEAEITKQRFANAKSFYSVVLEGLGHYPHVENPQKVINLIEEFLEEN
ncbi:hypothetical protein G9A89_014304 [Geosiphon pyriformis]|nr:hypothetical protein G9A89_014304 [Geosiphon pyriformis]